MSANDEKKLCSLKETIRGFNPKDMKKLVVPRLSTGMKSLDRALGGGISKGLYVLGAIPNLGKSTFILQIAQNISNGGTPVLFFSMEMTKERIASKALSRQLFLDNRDSTYSSDVILSERTASDNTFWERMEVAREKVEEACRNLYIIERGKEVASAKDIADIVEKYLKEQAEGKTPVVIVDYLQILTGEKTGNYVRDKAVVDYNVGILTELSKKLPVIAISSFNRTNYKVEVSMESFKESGTIEYSADVIMGMQLSGVGSRNFNINEEKNKNPRDVDIVVLKQRYGQSGNRMSLKYYPGNDYFKEVEQEIDVAEFYSHFSNLPKRSLD